MSVMSKHCSVTGEHPFLFEPVVPVSACHRCFDTGIWLSPQHDVLVCPESRIRKDHVEPNQASLMLHRAANLLSDKKIYINSQVFDVARILTNYTAQKPCERDSLIEFYYAETNLTAANRLRKFHAIIEELRNVWMLPVGSRKFDPSGYWVITEIEDCKAWIKAATAAPITQLATVWRVARHNFPVLAGQSEFAFMGALEAEAQK